MRWTAMGGLLNSQSCGLYQDSPPLNFARNKFGEIVRRPALWRNEIDTGLFQPFVHGRGFDCCDDRIMKALDDRCGCALGQEDSIPTRRLEIGEPLFVGGSQGGQPRRAIPRENRKSLDALTFDER